MAAALKGDDRSWQGGMTRATAPTRQAVRRVRVRLDRGALRQWHLTLLTRLSQRSDCRVQIEVVRAPDAALPPNTEVLFRFEAMIHGIPRPGLATPAAPAALAPFETADDGPADLVLDLCGADAPLPGQASPKAASPTTTCTTTWSLDFDGVPGEAGLLAASFAGTSPVAVLRDAFGEPVAVARLGGESQTVRLAAFEGYLARTLTLVEAALSGAASRDLPDGSPIPVAVPTSFDIGALAARRKALKGLARKIARHLYALCFRPERWRIGWRRTAGPDLIALRRHPAGGWTDLPDHAGGFYADPFALARNGAVTLFMEEFDYRRGKGVISAVPFGPEGPRGRPVPVLELDTHLSYPFVFEADGETWMIPESCGTGTIDLYRATRFPGGWVHEKVLVAGLVASDATLLRHGGRWWLFATVRDGGGSHSDSLHLWYAADFRGPWIAHPRNPVLIDIASARPAGPIVQRDGALIRPVQDCRGGYGAALGLARILRLDEDGFAQRVETRLASGPDWPGSRLHTYSAAGGFEFIDGSQRVRMRLPLR